MCEGRGLCVRGVASNEGCGLQGRKSQYSTLFSRNNRSSVQVCELKSSFRSEQTVNKSRTSFCTNTVTSGADVRHATKPDYRKQQTSVHKHRRTKSKQQHVFGCAGRRVNFNPGEGTHCTPANKNSTEQQMNVQLQTLKHTHISLRVPAELHSLESFSVLFRISIFDQNWDDNLFILNICDFCRAA